MKQQSSTVLVNVPIVKEQDSPDGDYNIINLVVTDKNLLYIELYHSITKKKWDNPFGLSYDDALNMENLKRYYHLMNQMKDLSSQEIIGRFGSLYQESKIKKNKEQIDEGYMSFWNSVLSTLLNIEKSLMYSHIIYDYMIKLNPSYSSDSVQWMQTFRLHVV